MNIYDTREGARLVMNQQQKGHWNWWGERAWGTVHEDYSANGDAWNYLPHDQARSRAYRWNEDGLAGINTCALPRACPHSNKTWNRLGSCYQITIRPGQAHG